MQYKATLLQGLQTAIVDHMQAQSDPAVQSTQTFSFANWPDPTYKGAIEGLLKCFIIWFICKFFCFWQISLHITINTGPECDDWIVWTSTAFGTKEVGTLFEQFHKKLNVDNLKDLSREWHFLRSVIYRWWVTSNRIERKIMLFQTYIMHLFGFGIIFIPDFTLLPW